jgi:hypothetical protein
MESRPVRKDIYSQAKKRRGGSHRLASLDDCRLVVGRQVEHLRRSGVAVDEMQRQESLLHGLSNPFGKDCRVRDRLILLCNLQGETMLLKPLAGLVVLASVTTGTPTPASKAPALELAVSCFYRGEQASGMNEICYYDCLGSAYAITVRAVDLCPLTIDT